MTDPKPESPKSSGKGREKNEDGGSPSNREPKPKKERGGNNKKQDANSEAMLRDLDENRVKI